MINPSVAPLEVKGHRMNAENEGRSRSRRRGNRAKEAAPAPKRDVNYHQLRNPFPMMNVFSDDQAEDMHQSALNILEDMGMRVLLPEARKIFAKAGARVEDEMVFILNNLNVISKAVAAESVLRVNTHSSSHLDY